MSAQTEHLFRLLEDIRHLTHKIAQTFGPVIEGLEKALYEEHRRRVEAELKLAELLQDCSESSE